MTRTIHFLLASAALLGGATGALAQLQEGEKPTEEQIKAGEAPATPIFEGETALRSLQNAVSTPLWTKEAARDLLRYVEGISADGLTPADYAPDALRAALAGNDESALRTAATDTFLRLSSDLALGHVRGDARIKDIDENTTRSGLPMRS